MLQRGFGRANGAKTVGITGNYLGKGAGKIKEVSDVCLVFDAVVICVCPSPTKRG